MAIIIIHHHHSSSSFIIDANIWICLFLKLGDDEPLFNSFPLFRIEINLAKPACQ
jgi:hypothetical protein